MASKYELQLYCTNLVYFHIEYLNAYKILEDTNTQRYSSSVKKIDLILKCFFCRYLDGLNHHLLLYK